MPRKNNTQNFNGNDEIEPDFTFEEMQKELWGKIDKDLPVIEYRKTDDIDKNQFEKHLIDKGIYYSSESIRRLMAKIGKKEGWKYISVFDQSIGHRIKVLRKIDSEN